MPLIWSLNYWIITLLVHINLAASSGTLISKPSKWSKLCWKPVLLYSFCHQKYIFFLLLGTVHLCFFASYNVNNFHIAFHISDITIQDEHSGLGLLDYPLIIFWKNHVKIWVSNMISWQRSCHFNMVKHWGGNWLNI